MTAALGTWRYLLRNGRFIAAAIRLNPDHVLPHVTKDGTVIFALLSANAEQLLLQSIRQLQPFSGSSDGSLTRHCCITDPSLTGDGREGTKPSFAHQ